MWSDFGNNPIEDGEVCPHCGVGPLNVVQGQADCPRCGSVFEVRLSASGEEFEEGDLCPECDDGELEESDGFLECPECGFVV